ncbi:MAG: S9 family peptidase [Vulcanimicrobiaceae bacterium]
MIRRLRFLAAAFAASSLLAGPGAALARPFALDDEASLVALGSPAFSPDGTRLLVVETRQHVVSNKPTSKLLAIDIASGAATTVSGAKDGIADPAWSPDGKRIAYLAYDAKKKRQVDVAAPDGRGSRALTAAPDGVQQFAWRPDGSALAYVTRDAPAHTKTDPRDFFEIANDDYLIRAAEAPSHIWLADVATATAHRLTAGAWSLPVAHPPSAPASPLSWSADGKRIAFVRAPSTHSGDAGESEIETVDVASGSIAALTDRHRDEGYPVFSPDGTHIAYSTPRDGDVNNVTSVFVAPAAGGRGIDISRSLDRNVVRKIWVDAHTLLVGAHADARNAMWLLRDDGTSQRVETGDVDPSEPFWLDAAVSSRGAIAYVGSQPARPSELWYQASAGAAPRRLTDVNGAIAALDLARSSELRFAGPDGFAEDAAVTYPLGYVPQKRYPLVVLPHGGPTAASQTSFSALPQLLAAHGYLVLQPNYRGSDNLGNAFQRAIYMDAGDGPGRDAMAALAALQATGSVDPTRIVVSGWSYGGFMTSWLMSHYHVWKAALSGAAVNDWQDQYDLGDANVRRAARFRGSPHVGNNLADYRAQSPITYAAQTTCPVLIVSDIGDYRVPVTQSFRMYHTLKDNGKDVRFIGIPVDGHNPMDIVRRMERDRLWVDWADRYLR